MGSIQSEIAKLQEKNKAEAKARKKAKYLRRINHRKGGK